jgi:PAS domain S-box-containing protein
MDAKDKDSDLTDEPLEAHIKESDFAIILETSSALFFRMEMDGTIISHRSRNPGLYYSAPEKFMGKKMQDVLPPDVGRLVSQAIEELGGEESEVTIEYTLEMSDGNRHYRMTMRVVDDKISAIVQDTTEREKTLEELEKHRDHLDVLVENRTRELEKANEQLRREVREREKAEQELRNAEEDLRTIIDSIPQIVYAKDRNGSFLLANKEFCNVLGVDHDRLMGKNFRKVHGVSREVSKMTAEDLKVIESGKMSKVRDEEFTGGDGITRTYKTTRIPYRNPFSSIPAILAVSIDQEETAKQERIAQQLHLQFLGSLDYLDAVVLIFDPLEKVILHANAAATDTFGEWEGKTCHDFLCPNDEEPCELCADDEQASRSDEGEQEQANDSAKDDMESSRPTIEVVGIAGTCEYEKETILWNNGREVTLLVIIPKE